MYPRLRDRVATQATSHFVLNADHYAALTYLRPEPIIPMGILSMLIQGGVLSVLYSRLANQEKPALGSLSFAWLGGAILVSYIALAEAAKYTVPDIGSWIAVELAAGAVQFTLYGMLLGVVYRFRAPASRRIATGTA